MNNLRPQHPALASLLLLAGACGPGLDSGSLAEDELSSSSHAIVGGTTDNGHDAVALLYQDPGYICSGTIIDERVYLTAAHCIESTNPNDYLVVGGTNPFDNEDYLIEVDEVHIHPGYEPANNYNDVGIVILASDSPVKPYRWLTSGATAGDVYDVGTTFTAVGYGDTGGAGDTSGKKRKVDMDIVEVYSDIIVYGTGTENTCFGDSGGPDLVTIDGYPTVIGVHSFVTGGDCFQYGGSMRTDDNRTFIDNYASPNAGTSRIGSGSGGGGGGSKNPLACSVASVSLRSPFAAMLLALAAFGSVAIRRRAHALPAVAPSLRSQR